MAGRIPESFINDLLARVDIVDVIDEHVPLKKTGRNFQARCPFHDERTPSFSVSPDKQFYYCFGCGASGSVIGFLIDYLHMDFVEAVHDLAGRVGLAVPAEAGFKGKSGELERLYALLVQAQQYYSAQLKEHPQSERAKNYLKGRGLDGRTAAAFQLGYAPPGWDNLLKTLGAEDTTRDLEAAGLLVPKDGGSYYDRFRDRIMFPIPDQRGRVIGFGGRVLGNDEPKYLNSPETPLFHKGRELYGLLQARKANRQLQRLFAVEGYMDVIALHQHGVTNAVATLGTATTPDHLERLFKATPEVVFCFDGDEAGSKAAWRALQTSLPVLKEGRYISFLFLPAGEDPDSLVRKDGPAVFNNPKRYTPLSDFLFNTLLAQVNPGTDEGRAKLVDLAKPLLSGMPAGAYKQLLAQRLAKLAGMDLPTVAALIGAKAVKTASVLYPREGRPTRRSPSLVRSAIRLLLHKPALALKLEAAPNFGALSMAGMPLLQELIEMIRTQPGMNSAAVLEHWRDREETSHLRKLLLDEIPDAEGAEQEFMAAIAKLCALSDKKKTAATPNKPPSEYTEEEKSALRGKFKSGRPSKN
jgi:DNA primase